MTATDVKVTTNRSPDPREIGGVIGDNRGRMTDVSKMNDDGGDRVNTAVRDGTAEIATPNPLASDLPTPTDPDGDGDFEDINGNGRIDYTDVVELFNEVGS